MKGEQIVSREKERVNTARLKKFGKTFEIVIEPEAAIRFKTGGISDIREVLKSPYVYFDAQKGLLAAESDLGEIFKTTQPEEIAKIILKEGEIQVNEDYRRNLIEQKRRRIIDLIRQEAMDPTTKLPIPLTRIEQALEQAKVKIDLHRQPEEQFENIISQLKPFLPLKIEKKQLEITIPATHAARIYSLVKNQGKILKEEWKNDGSWQIFLEIPAGRQIEVIEKLSSLTRGEAEVKIK